MRLSRFIIVACLALACGACALPTDTTPPAAAVVAAVPLRGRYGLAAPVVMEDGRTLYWVQLSFWGKYNRADGDDTWTGTYSVKEGFGTVAALDWGTFTVDEPDVELGTPNYRAVRLAPDRRTIDVVLIADGTPVQAQLVLNAPSPL